MNAPTAYETQAARDAQARGYGDRSYWDYLERAEKANREMWLRRGDLERAENAMSRTLSEALRGNDGI